MSTPIPSPFDIIEPPPGPIVPSPMAWILTALFFAAMLALSRLLYRRMKTPPLHTLVATLLDEFKRAASQSHTSLAVERIARLTKRILSVLIADDVDSLSSSEIRSLAISLSRSSDERQRSSAAILELLAQVEELAYAPQDSTPEIQSLISQLERSLEEHVRRHGTR
jgi:hypothetical protein